MKSAVLLFSLCVFLKFVSSDTKDEAALRVVPNRSQFFQYESVSLICELQGNSSTGWRIKRNTSKYINKDCFNFCDEIKKSSCYFEDVYPSDTGVYWCESAAGESSNSVSISVTGGDVILEGPVLPVMEGDDVTLSCRSKKTVSCNLTADFYKDGLLIGSSSTGNMTIHSVSRSDEGLYRCNISGAGASPASRLTVRADAPAAQVMSVFRLIWHVVVATPYLLSTILLILIYRDNRRAARLVGGDRSYDVVMETEDDKPRYRY
ncbi:high affinity immunoglobulin gamma Fc receptor I-like isoform X2 [Acanthopagrus latus]|uniref:high affinity immunoglobulin gamma Fc receptor I-like isoform X2 n=1 Tax=Acanthopagrus latus TaxID=8177 RepID=UPI00187C8359|nr:high affinity immunoglobulin gamma Fc receptor I-like isoform X2 [Acanthopagrus latus]